MMTKKQMIIIAIAGILLIGGSIAAAIFSNRPVDEPSTSQDSVDKKDPRLPDEPIDESNLGSDTDADPKNARPLTIDKKATSPEQVESKYVPMAEKAAKAYVFQQTHESKKDRQKRLKAVFTADSSAISSKAPVVDMSQSYNITANPIVVGGSWDVKSGDQLVVTVSLRVICRSNDSPYDEVSDIYQAYDVGFVRYNGSYKPHTIKFSDKPIILRN